MNKKTEISKYPPHMQKDYVRRNKNIDDEKTLCGKCEGTGNELYSMYKKCTRCGGKGFME
jgi:DnaJ-class molecular chaperone